MIETLREVSPSYITSWVKLNPLSSKMVEHTQTICRSCHFNDVVNLGMKLYQNKHLILSVLLQILGTFSGNVFFKKQFRETVSSSVQYCFNQ